MRFWSFLVRSIQIARRSESVLASETSPRVCHGGGSMDVIQEKSKWRRDKFPSSRARELSVVTGIHCRSSSFLGGKQTLPSNRRLCRSFIIKFVPWKRPFFNSKLVLSFSVDISRHFPQLYSTTRDRKYRDVIVLPKYFHCDGSFRFRLLPTVKQSYAQALSVWIRGKVMIFRNIRSK